MKTSPQLAGTDSIGIGFACQTYSWQMALERYRGQFDTVASEVSAAGFRAIEPEVVMLGEFFEAPRLHELLAEKDLQLAAITLVAAWERDEETSVEREIADATIELVRTFPGTKLNLCQDAGGSREGLQAKQEACLLCLGAIARRAAMKGVKATFHPNSPETSKFRTKSDYEFLLSNFPSQLGFTPDLGHIAKGGMDPLEIVKRFRDIVEHVHVKDMDAVGVWAPIGSGIVPAAAVIEYLNRTGFRGWVVMEDESPEAAEWPAAAAVRNYTYVRELIGCI